MVPTDFDQSNHVIDKPADMERDDCDPLCIEMGVFRCGDNQNPVPVMQSCWKLTAGELEEINRTGRVWLGVCGFGMPPVIMSGHRLELEHVEP